MSTTAPPEMDRRTMLKATAGAAASAMALSGGASGQQAKQPDWPDYVADAKGGSYEDLRGQSEVTVEVGGGDSQLAFLPTKIWIDPGTTVTFKWVSDGHNVLPKDQPEGSEWQGSGSSLENTGYTYTHTFETTGIYTYFCQPHEALGMKGAIAVGDDVPTATPGNVQPKFGGYLSDAKGGSFEDLRGQSEVTVEVGGGDSQLAFLPTKIWIDPGTTVTFKWVSDGHNVLPESQPDGANWQGSGQSLENTGYTYTHTFETTGIYTYFCQPHEALGMKGGIAVGDDVPTTSVETPAPSPGGDGGGDQAGGGGGEFTLPGGEMGVVMFAIAFGSAGIGAVAIFGAEIWAAIHRSRARAAAAAEAVDTGGEGVTEAVPELRGTEEELDHDEYDPWGTASLIVIYFLILVGMWIFVYFVEFLGGGPVVTG